MGVLDVRLRFISFLMFCADVAGVPACSRCNPFSPSTCLIKRSIHFLHCLTFTCSIACLQHVGPCSPRNGSSICVEFRSHHGACSRCTAGSALRDHIPQVAIHFNVASFFLPTETFFDDESWWSGQFMYNIVASYYFPQQWIQINSIYCENKEHRDETLQTRPSDAAAPVKSYNRVVSFDRPLIWLLSSFKTLSPKQAT